MSAHVLPWTISALLEQDRQANSVIMKDIYNAQTQIWNKALNRQTPIQVLVKNMSSDSILRKVQHDNCRHVTHLFFAYRRLLDMYQSYPEVLLINNTYKTNRFHMPHCSIMGISCIFCCLWLLANGARVLLQLRSVIACIIHSRPLELHC